MKRSIFFTPVFLVASILSACGKEAATATAAETVAITSTPDPCSPQNLPGEVTKVNDLMREFDDYSLVAQNTPQSQLTQVIPAMQKIVRDAENQKVPACIMQLKKFQLGHMNAVIQTLLVLLGNPQPNQDVVNAINTGIQQARELHRQYDLERARLLGITVVVSPTSAASPGTPEAAIPGEASTPAMLTVTNSGATGIVLLALPDPNAGGVATLAPGLTVLAFGQTADGKWIQVEVPNQPGQKAWVDATLITASGTLPIVAP